SGGGLTDRCDYQLVTGELMDGTGLEIIPSSYHAFANNGSVPVGGEITSSTDLMWLPPATRTQVLSLLTTVTDHLPVVADYYVVGHLQFSMSSYRVRENGGAAPITVSP